MSHTKMMYIEKCTGTDHNGPAWIAKIQFSKSQRSIYFNGRCLKKNNCFVGNHYDIETEEEYWISGVSKGRSNKHWDLRKNSKSTNRIYSNSKIMVEKRVLELFLAHTGSEKLDSRYFLLIGNLQNTDKEKLEQAALQAQPMKKWLKEKSLYSQNFDYVCTIYNPSFFNIIFFKTTYSCLFHMFEYNKKNISVFSVILCLTLLQNTILSSSFRRSRKIDQKKNYKKGEKHKKNYRFLFWMLSSCIFDKKNFF